MMTLDEVIRHLQEEREKHGGAIPVFVNGEFGEGQALAASKEYFSFGEAEITLGSYEDNNFGIKKRNTILQIGGY